MYNVKQMFMDWSRQNSIYSSESPERRDKEWKAKRANRSLGQ